MNLKIDPEVDEVIGNELVRQRNCLNLIASENFVSRNILKITGSILTNKYSEGYPGRRYYGGNRFIDASENLAIERAKKLFKAAHANVQPHSGVQANMAAYFALLNIGDKILSMNLAHGGHLSHGSPVSFAGKWYKIIHYGIKKETGRIDMDEVRRIALQEKPKLIIAGASAYPREINFKLFKEITDEVGAFLVADIAHIAGLVAKGVHQSSIPYADITTTTTHKTLRGPRGGLVLCEEKHAAAVDKAVFPGIQGGPLEHIIAAKAVAFYEALQPEFKEYIRQVIKNAKVLSETLMEKGFTLISGGTDNHLMLVDLTNMRISGKEAEAALEEVGIVVNKNMIPFDKRNPFDPSGIRIGTPALTTRGMRESEMKEVGNLIAKTLKNINNKEVKKAVKDAVLELCNRFPLYPDL